MVMSANLSGCYTHGYSLQVSACRPPPEKTHLRGANITVRLASSLTGLDSEQTTYFIVRLETIYISKKN